MHDRCGPAGGHGPAALPKPPDRHGTMTRPADTAAAWPEHAPLATTASSPELPDLGARTMIAQPLHAVHIGGYCSANGSLGRPQGVTQPLGEPPPGFPSRLVR